MLFNDAWSQKGHSVSDKTVTLGIKLLISIIITYYCHIYYHIITFISITNLFILSYTGLFLCGKNEHGHNYPMKELPLMYLLNNASVYCQQTQHSLLVSGLLSVLRCN